MRAKEARKIAQSHHENDWVAELIEIEYKIREAANKGMFGIQVKIHDQRTFDYLKSQGYNVLNCINIGNLIYTVTW